MNTLKKIKSILSALAAGFATVAGLDVNGFTAVFPPEVSKWLVIIPSAAAIFVHLIEAGIKSLDSLETLPLWILAASCLFALPSCVSTTTTAPDGSSVTTRRVDREALRIGADVLTVYTLSNRDVIPEK